MCFDTSEPGGLLLWSPVFGISVLGAVSGRSDCPLANERELQQACDGEERQLVDAGIRAGSPPQAKALTSVIINASDI